MTLSSRRVTAMVAPATLSIVLFVLLAASPARAAGSPDPPTWPLHPRPGVMRGFEPPPQPWAAGHRGVDLAGSPGQPVLSATAGTIAYAGQLAGRGVIVVAHGSFRTTYEPVVPEVRAGATVTAGERIGRLSAAGSHCPPGACLHWGLRRGEEYLDPLSLLKSGSVRLLPLSQPGPRPPEPIVRSGPPVGSSTPVGTASVDLEVVAGSAGGQPAQVFLRGDGVTGEPGAGREVPALWPEGEAPALRPDGDGRSGRDGAGGLVVGIAAAVTLGATLLTRRH